MAKLGRFALVKGVAGAVASRENGKGYQVLPLLCSRLLAARLTRHGKAAEATVFCI